MLVVVAHALGPTGLGEVRDLPVAPAVHLVAEQARTAQDRRSHRALGDHPPVAG